MVQQISREEISDRGDDFARQAQLATLNILEDFNHEKVRLEDTQRAVLNILDDFNVEKSQIEKTQKATLNILEDFDRERLRSDHTQRAVLNILDDFDTEKNHLEKTQKATLNILEDFNHEMDRMADTHRAVLNILDDFDEEKSKVERTNLLLSAKSGELDRANRELQQAQEVLEARVEERTAELKQSNVQLRAEMDERKKVEEALYRRTTELARSNAELEQFAYVASHDLQEPLRMISSYVQLLVHRYKGKLDQDADDFIGYAADGASRMQRLINDLLAYSRVGTRGKSFEQVSLDAILHQATENLHLAVEEKHAVITHDPLPVVYGDSGQLTQVLQNLIDNAIKFRGEEPPQIHISARLQDTEWVISVRDNGIGIAPEFVGKLFTLFQRLHTRKEYPGTGLGLAICKRIVERHGGRIWVESHPGEGATFFFTLPLEKRSY